MIVRILTVGEKSSPDHAALIAEYEKRLPKTLNLSWQLVQSGRGDPKSSMRAEAENLLSKISGSDYVILLDETGKQLTSPGLSEKLFNLGRDVTIIIGGAFGVDEAVTQRADFVWSLSKLVFPHQLVRIILTEQLYRAAMIHQGHPYHHS